MRFSAEQLNTLSLGYLPDLVGMRAVTVDRNRVVCRMPVRRDLLAPNGFLHAAAVIALADTACGFGTLCRLPDGANSFTTIELKSNFLGTATEGTLECEAVPVHEGRNTQVWDATVEHLETCRRTAIFRCTQMILWPKG